MANKSRAEYFRERRKDRKQFTVMIDRETMERFEQKLQEIGKTKVQWFIEKVRETLGE